MRIMTVLASAPDGHAVTKGLALTLQGNYAEAITYFDRALAIDPNDREALDHKQAAQQALGHKARPATDSVDNNGSTKDKIFPFEVSTGAGTCKGYHNSEHYVMYSGVIKGLHIYWSRDEDAKHTGADYIQWYARLCDELNSGSRSL